MYVFPQLTTFHRFHIHIRYSVTLTTLRAMLQPEDLKATVTIYASAIQFTLVFGSTLRTNQKLLTGDSANNINLNHIITP